MEAEGNGEGNGERAHFVAMSMFYYATSFVHAAHTHKVQEEQQQGGEQVQALEGWPTPSLRSLVRALDDLCALPFATFLRHALAHKDTDTESKAFERCQVEATASIRLSPALQFLLHNARRAQTSSVPW